MLNIVVPMAGRGSRFANAGFTAPKPLIEVGGEVPMIRLVIENLRPHRREARFVFLCLREHLGPWDLERRLVEWAGPGTVIVPVDEVTEGAACTVLLARHLIDSDEPLMIANSDQYVDVAIDDYLDHEDADDLDGLIMTMTADDPKWSFLRLDGDEVTEVVEKEVVSNEATVGIYNFRRGRDFVAGADAMIAGDFRVNGEFYVAPVYNALVARSAAIGWVNVGSEANGMYGLGIPADLALFESLPVCRAAMETAMPHA